MDPPFMPNGWLPPAPPQSSFTATMTSAPSKRKTGTRPVIFSDTLLWRADHPPVCTSIRGMLGARLEVYGPLTDIHGGAVSGVAPNPAFELSNLLAQLHAGTTATKAPASTS